MENTSDPFVRLQVSSFSFLPDDMQLANSVAKSLGNLLLRSRYEDKVLRYF